jgi:hypothetical protein
MEKFFVMLYLFTSVGNVEVGSHETMELCKKSLTQTQIYGMMNDGDGWSMLNVHYGIAALCVPVYYTEHEENDEH